MRRIVDFWYRAHAGFALKERPLDLNHGPLARYFEHLVQENTAKSRAILVEVDRVADILGLDDELLDGLVVGLGLR